MSETLPEPWMRGPELAVHPAARPFVYSMTQVWEDLAEWTEGLTDNELWARLLGRGRWVSTCVTSATARTG